MALIDLVNGAWDENRPPDPELIKDCVHCGFCLPTCPSYLVFEEEMDSPRGRIVLMRVGHEADEISDEMFTHPGRLRALAPVLALQQRTGINDALAKLPIPKLRSLLQLAPEVSPRAAVRQLPTVTPARGPARGRIALMQGCVQRVFFGDVNAATVRVLAAEGWEVHAPRTPRCCGALQLHTGVEDEAIALAKATIAAYEDFEHVAVNVAGCGSGMKDYAHLLAADPAWAERAKAFAAKVRDVSELLAEVEPRAPRHPLPMRVAYHDACHLAHAQRVRVQPRALLNGIPGLELREPAEWELCCGSAGIYNLVQPAAAAELGARKAANLRATGAEAVAAGNPGCAIQIGAHLDLPVFHPMTLLDHSIRGTRP